MELRGETSTTGMSTESSSVMKVVDSVEGKSTVQKECSNEKWADITFTLSM